jgi:hypothetical protein
MSGAAKRSFSMKLWERVVQMVCWTFVSTYVGSIPAPWAHHLIAQAAGMTVSQRGLLSAVAGLIQFAVGKWVAPRVGNPNTPDLVPSIILKRFGVPESLQEPLEVTITEIIEAAVHAAKAHPDAPVTVEDVAKQIVHSKEKPPAS